MFQALVVIQLEVEPRLANDLVHYQVVFGILSCLKIYAFRDLVMLESLNGLYLHLLPQDAKRKTVAFQLTFQKLGIFVGRNEIRLQFGQKTLALAFGYYGFG